jgi:hypothetical protein
MGTLRTILAERDAALAQARLIAEQELETVRRGQEAALSSAMSAWKDAEAARLAAAETSWRKRSDASLAEAAGRRDRAEAALAEMRAQFEAAVKSVGDDVEHHLRGELATLRANLCERDVAIAQARTCAEQSAVSVAEMSARCERAEAEASRAQAEAAESSTRQECETRRLHAELSSALAVLADRDASLEQTRLTAERALQRAQRESDAALAKAQSRWKADENARFAATEAQWRKQSASALAEATARYKEAETALAQIRVKSADQGESETVARMRHEIEMLRSALANHDDQLLRAAPAHERRDTPPSRIAIRETHDWESAEPREQKSPTSRRLIRDVIVVAVLAASAIIFWPRLESYIPAGWFPGAAESEPVPNSQATATTATLSPPQPMAMVIRSANVHADPAKTAAVITTLQHGMQIEVIGGRNNWTLVRINGKGGKPQQGWVYSSFLKVLGDKSLPAAKQ